MDAGELVPDEIVVGVVEECLAPGGPLDDGFVLDGFPRTLQQAARARPGARWPPARRRHQHRRPARDRARPLAGRRVCESCQRVYHVNLPPTSGWTCDTCGGDVVQRDDDTEEAIERRLELYERETVPIIDYYREQSAARGRSTGRRRRRGLRPHPDDGRATGCGARPVVLRKTPPRSRTCGGRVASSPRCTRSASGRRSPARRPPISTAPLAMCSIAGTPGRTSSATTGSRRWPASRRTR